MVAGNVDQLLEARCRFVALGQPHMVLAYVFLRTSLL